jgi:hypothetical protein
MNTINRSHVLDELEKQQQQTEQEKRVQEMLEKKLLEKKQQEKILEELAMKNTERAQQTTQNLDSVFQESKRLSTQQSDIVAKYKQTIETAHLKQKIHQLTQAIEASIIRALKTQEFKNQDLTKPLDQTQEFKNQDLTKLLDQTQEYEQFKDPEHFKRIKQLKNNIKNKTTTPKAIIQQYIAHVFELTPIGKQTNTDPSKQNSKTLTKVDMLALGATESDLDSLSHLSESIIKQSMKQTMKQNLKQLVVQSLLATINNQTVSDQLDAKALESSYVSVINSLKSSRKLGHSDTIDALHTTILEEAKEEVRYALQTIVRQTQSDSNGSKGQPQDSDALTIDRMFERAQQMGIISDNTKHWVQDPMTVDLFDLGHMLLDFGNSTDSDDTHSNTHAYSYTQDDEHDIVLDRIRANLMQLAISGSFISGLVAKFKLTVDKRRGVKLGIYNKKMEHKLTTKAKQQAVTQLQAMLNEALLERASFHTEFGTDWDNNATKIKGVIRNLQRLDVGIDADTLLHKITQANRAMKPIVELEQASIQTILDEPQVPSPVRHALSERLAQIKRVHQRIQSAEPVPVESKQADISADQYRSICTNV